ARRRQVDGDPPTTAKLDRLPLVSINPADISSGAGLGVLLIELVRRVIIRLPIDVIRWVDREKHEPRRRGAIDIRRGFQMIGVRPLLPGPTGGPGGAYRIRHDLFRRTIG